MLSHLQPLFLTRPKSLNLKALFCNTRACLVKVNQLVFHFETPPVRFEGPTSSPLPQDCHNVVHRYNSD